MNLNDTLAAIDAAVDGCGWCGRGLDSSPPDYFCSEEHQRLWTWHRKPMPVRSARFDVTADCSAMSVALQRFADAVSGAVSACVFGGSGTRTPDSDRGR